MVVHLTSVEGWGGLGNEASHEWIDRIERKLGVCWAFEVMRVFGVGADPTCWRSEDEG